MKNKDAAKLNPCLKEQELTYKCFDAKNYDKEACKLEILNYQTCKSFWGFVQAQRRMQGIRPPLPPLEEREEAKKQYFEQYARSHR